MVPFMDAYGKGKIKIEKNQDLPSFVDGKWVACTMNDVLYVPGMKRNLFSIRSVTRSVERCSVGMTASY